MTNRDKLIKKNNLEGMEISEKITRKYKDNKELALLRKEIRHIEEALNIAPTEKFAEYYEDAETAKANIRQRLAEGEEA